MIKGDLHVEVLAVCHSCNVLFGVQHLDLCIGSNVACSYVAGTGCFQHHRLGTGSVQLYDDALYVQNDLGAVLLDTGHGRDLVKHISDVYGGSGISGKRAKQDAAQGIAQRDTVASFQRLYHEFATAAIFTQVNRCNIGFLYLNHNKSSYLFFGNLSLTGGKNITAVF